MDKDKNKGLADSGDGEFILNESGTSVTIDSDQVYPEDKISTIPPEHAADKKDQAAEDTIDSKLLCRRRLNEAL